MNFVFYATFFLGAMLEFCFYKKLTPNIISFIGIVIISLLYDIFGKHFNFIEVSNYAYSYFIVFFIIGVLSSISIKLLFKMVDVNNNFDGDKYLKLELKMGIINRNLYICFVLAILALCMLGVYKAYNVTGIIAGEEYESLLTFGVIGHLFTVLLSTIPFTYIILTKCELSKNMRYLLKAILLMSFILVFLKLIKYWVTLPIIWLFLIKWYTDKNYTIRELFFSLIIVVVVVVGLFFASYLFQIYGSGNSDAELSPVIESLFTHLLAYLFSGLLVFSSLIEDGYLKLGAMSDGLVIFNGFVNIISLMTEFGIYDGKVIETPFYIINLETKSTGNVGTLFSSLILYGGAGSLIIYFIMISFLNLLLLLSKKSTLSTLLYTSLCMFMFMSWFASYFSLLIPYEVPVLVCLLYFTFIKFKYKIA